MTATVAVFHHPFSPRVPDLLERAVLAAGARSRAVDVPSLGIGVEPGLTLFDRHGPIEVSHAGPLLGFWYPNALVGLGAMEQLGVRVTNGAAAITTADDKASTALAFAGRDVRQPATTVVPIAAAAAAAAGHGFPCVLKLPVGAQGRWVRLASSRTEAEAIVEEFREEAPRTDVLVQEYRPVWHGRSIRVICLDDEVLAASRRVGPDGELVSNIGAGGRQEPLDLDARQRSLALAALAAVGLRFGGVDLLDDAEQPFALEVNSHPDFSSMGTSVSRDIAAALVGWLLGD